MSDRGVLTEARRIVVKLGTALVVRKESAEQVPAVDRDFIRSFAAQVAGLHKGGVETIVVSSGAIGTGLGVLDRREVPQALRKLQAAAAIGQCRLMNLYADAFDEVGIHVGQVLLNRGDTENRTRYLNARNTIQQLLVDGVVPIVNENDSTAVEEITFGDNDILSALVTNLSEAGVLIILTVVDGLMTADPKEVKNARLVDTVEEVNEQMMRSAGPGKTAFGRGGMRSKLSAAAIVTSAGEACVIANGHGPRVLERILAGESIGTYFVPSKKRMGQRKRWIAWGSGDDTARIIVDAGARRALTEGKKSLLAGGIRAVEGTFAAGDSIAIATADGEVFARGITAFSSEEIESIRGKKTAQVVEILGERGRAEVVHRDKLVVMEQ